MLFGEKELQQRDKYLADIQGKIPHLVLSSKDAAAHYREYYPDSTIQVEVLPFVSDIQAENLPEIVEVKQKYGIEGDYFMVANQFWEHKNHWVVMQAMKKMVEVNKQVYFIFTGKEEDHRNPNYFPDLKTFASENNLTKNISFLGFIDREDQLSLLQHAKAIVQPSKFEGWGTVVEDAKTLNQLVLASDIPVHHEQLGTNAYFFGPDDADRLSELLLGINDQSLNRLHEYRSLEERKLEFAKRFIEITLA